MWRCECGASDHHAAIRACWPSIVAIFRQPSILRNLICLLATRLKSNTSAASSLGSEPCIFTRRRNSSWSRSIVFVSGMKDAVPPVSVIAVGDALWCDHPGPGHLGARRLGRPVSYHEP